MRFPVAREQWHQWFAWRPVRVGDSYVYGEVIERRWSETFCGSEWEYRFVAAADPA